LAFWRIVKVQVRPSALVVQPFARPVVLFGVTSVVFRPTRKS